MAAAAEYIPYVGIDEVTKDKLGTVRSLIAETVGTLFLVFVGCGSCVHPMANIVSIALAFGIAVASMAQTVGHVSGCHINPAVTAGLFFGRKIGLIKSLMYILFQMLGGIIGAALLQAVVGSKNGLGMTSVSDKISAGQAFGIEFLITMVLVFVVFGAAADENNVVGGSPPLAIGLSITACHLFAVPFTGSSMNPARTFGPAVILGDWANHWVYWIGPLLGGIVAALLYQLVMKAEAKSEDKTYAAVSTKDEDAAAKAQP